MINEIANSQKGNGKCSDDFSETHKPQSSQVLLLERNVPKESFFEPTVSLVTKKKVILPQANSSANKVVQLKRKETILSSRSDDPPPAKRLILTSKTQVSGSIQSNISEDENNGNKKFINLENRDSFKIKFDETPFAKKINNFSEPINLSLKSYEEDVNSGSKQFASSANQKYFQYALKTSSDDQNTSAQYVPILPKVQKDTDFVHILPKIQKPRESFSSQIPLESILTPSESQLSHSVSITPIRKIQDQHKHKLINEEENIERIQYKVVQCRFCHANFPPHLFNDHSCMKRRQSIESYEECGECGKRYSTLTELDRHKCHSSTNDIYHMQNLHGEQLPVSFIKEEPNDEDPLNVVRQSGNTKLSENDIDDDEEAYLQNYGNDLSKLVQVKLECNNESEDMEAKVLNGSISTKKVKCNYCEEKIDSDQIKEHISLCCNYINSHVVKSSVVYNCPRCPRSYAKKQLAELHLQKVHNQTKQKQKCDICGVRFINVKAHKEKYHYFVDVDSCHLCGKVVKYLASHHCPLQDEAKESREAKVDCPQCGNMVKQKYLKIHQKNHCVGVQSSTFLNFRHSATGNEKEEEARKPLQLTKKYITLEEEKVEQREIIQPENSQVRKEVLLLPRDS